MQIAFVHQVGANPRAVAVDEQHVIRQHHGGACLTVRFQAAVDVLQKIQLLVGGGKGEIVAGGALAAFLGAEGRIGQHHVEAAHLLTLVGKGVGQQKYWSAPDFFSLAFFSSKPS